MRRLAKTSLCGAFIWAVAGVATQPALASNLCVGKHPGCFSQIQGAVNAANDGDTIEIEPGTFAGGITIDVSVSIKGAGARKTVINGGGPVITVGELLAASEPTVSISGVSITGGIARTALFGDTFAALGGGVFVPVSADFERGATVTIRDSVISDNRTAPAAILPGSEPPFALAEGGGIDSSGVLTLINTRVTGNQSGSAAGDPPIVSDAIAGGIYSHIQGVLTIRRSVVSGNRANTTSPNGHFAAGGGITSFGVMTLTDSVVSDNAARASASVTGDAEQVSLAGGIWLAECCGPAPPTRIVNTTVRGNRAEARAVSGDAVAFAGGILDEGNLVLLRSAVEGNEVSASIPLASDAGAVGDGGGLEIGGVAIIRESRITGNSVTMTAANGFALAQGGGLANAGQTTLENVIVVGNSATANGSDGVAQGGGVWNGTFGGQDPAPELTLINSVIVANRLRASPGIPAQGGGLYTDFPATLTKTVIAGNQPDQCFGC